MEELFVGPVMEKLISTGFEYLTDQVRWQAGMKEELQRLRENHPKIKAVVFASSQEQIRDQNPALNEWLSQLRDAIDEADDVIDELEYMRLKKQLTRNVEKTKVRSATTSFVYETARKLRKVGERALKVDPRLKRLEEVVHKLDKVSADVGTFLHLVKDAKQEDQDQEDLHRTRETGSLPKNDQIGRAKEKEFVKQWLRKPTNEPQTHISGTTLHSNISILSIVGHGGMGKTTLLQHVYEDEMTKEFDLKMWVCVSYNFVVKRVIADMLEYLIKERPRLESLGTLQESLKSAVKSKKFLLVLDDIWEEEVEERDKSKWENVLAPLAFGSLGSKILVTTRMDSVALMIANVINKKNETLRLEGLKDDECLLLLNRYAFANVENPTVHHKLRSIAEKIVKKLSGSPLAARVVGGVLNSCLDESHWTRVLNYDIGSQNGILSILKLSYIFLPKPLQNCFAFCGIFPQDYKFDKDDLIQMWIALSFIQPPYIQGETVKDAGERYFDVLVKKSLFEKFQIEDRIYYKLHDLLRELVRSVSAQECFSIVGDEELLFKIPQTIRHLSIETNNLGVFKKMEKLKNLHSLYLSCCNDYKDFIDVLPEIFKTLRSIRLLYIYAPYLKQIPEEIGHLIHLRYLKIVETNVTLLPRSLSNLYHLQFIIYSKKLYGKMDLPDDFLSRDMNNLPNLHCMKLPFPGMHGIGKLSSLQELDGFYIKNKDGYKIGELEHMNELRLLIINLLENVKDAEDACSAKLRDKSKLTDLSLVWRGIYFELRHYSLQIDHRSIVDADLDEKVLDNLQPHNNLNKLKIYSFMGVRSPIWMNNIHLISNLEYIQLEDCLEWQTLPPFGQLRFLKTLCLRNMPKVKQFDYKFHGNDKDCLFPSLQVLAIKSLKALEDWFDARAATDDCLFPCLTELCLQDCPNLQELPSLPPKLEKLEIDNIEWNAFNLLRGTSNCCSISIRNLSNLISLRGLQEVETTKNRQLKLSELIINDPSVLLMDPLRSITSIQKLSIKANLELVSFPFEAEQWFLQVSSSLCELNFKRLKSLQSLPSSLQSLSSLKILRVKKVPQLQLLPSIPASLEQLELVEIEYLESLPSSMESLPSLKILRVEEVPQLHLLPNIPASLEQLWLVELKSLQYLPSSLSFSSLKHLVLRSIPLQKLPDLPPSLCGLWLAHLDYVDCLPTCPPILSSLEILHIEEVPQLRELPDLPPSLKSLSIENCHLELMERYQMIVGSDWHKIARIPRVHIK